MLAKKIIDVTIAILVFYIIWCVYDLSKTHAQPYKEFQFSEEEEANKKRPSDIIKVRKEFQDYVKNMKFNEDALKVKDEVYKFCNKLDQKYHQVICTSEVEEYPAGWALHIDVFYDSYNFETFGIVRADNKINNFMVYSKNTEHRLK